MKNSAPAVALNGHSPAIADAAGLHNPEVRLGVRPTHLSDPESIAPDGVELVIETCDAGERLISGSSVSSRRRCSGSTAPRSSSASSSTATAPGRLRSHDRDATQQPRVCPHGRVGDQPDRRQATEVDHIIPLSAGRTDHPANLRGLCSECHHGEHSCARNVYPETR